MDNEASRWYSDSHRNTIRKINLSCTGGLCEYWYENYLCCRTLKILFVEKEP